MDKLKILLSEGSSLSARHTLFALGSSPPRYTIDVMDPRSLCLGRFSRFVRKFHRCPHYAEQPAKYLERLAQLIQREKYDVLLATHEQVFLLSRFRDTLAKHVGVALPSFAAMETTFGKAGFLRLLDELQLPHPPTTIVRRREELVRDWDFPCYIKLAYSTAGRGVHHIESKAQLVELANAMDQAGRLDGQYETLVQQPARGTQSTVQAVFQRGRLVGSHVFMARQVGVAGMSSARVSASHPEVVEHVRRLGSRLEWHGGMFIDYFYDDQIGPQYLECNPRIGETMNAVFCGINLCELLVRVSLGETVEPLTTTAKPGVRSHSGFMNVMTRAVRGGNRRQLVAEYRQCRKQQGDLYHDSQDELTRPAEDLLSWLPAAFVNTQLFLWPRIAESIVNRTVRAYSVPEGAVETIRQLPEDTLEKCFAQTK